MWNCNSDANSYSYGYANGNCHGDRISHTHADGDANIDTVRRKMFSDTAASPDSSASPVSGFGPKTADSLAMRLTRLTETRLQRHSI